MPARMLKIEAYAPRTQGRRTAGPRGVEPPLYLKVAQVLKDEILSGVHPVGAYMPTEQHLIERFAVSRHTVREALRRLRDDNLISSRQGAGTKVAAPRFSPADVHHVTSISDLLAFAAGLRLDVRSVRLVRLGEAEAKRLGVLADEDWLEVRAVRCAESGETPVCLADYYINREFAAVGRLLRGHTGPVFPLIEDLFGRRIEAVEQEIAAAEAASAVAEALGVTPGSTILEVRRTYRLAEGQIAQITLNTHPAARFRHAMTLRRARPDERLGW